MILLGSTGSIGVNTLLVAKKFGLSIEVLVAGKNINLLNQQIQEHNPKVVVIADANDLHKVHHPNVKAGNDAIIQAIQESKSDVVVNALVGFVGLRPTIESIKLKKRVALANKESLVVAGAFLDTSFIDPIDSEHFALWYLQNDRKIQSMLITASGGSFRDTPIDLLQNVSIKEALKHPNWSMGNKITIDSATMTNKLFEIMEAFWLFRTKKLDAVIETKSLLHAVVNFCDGSSTAHFAHANMQLPIAYALLKKVDEPILQGIDFQQLQSLEFRQITTDRYPIWHIKEDLLNNPHLGVVVNSANEVAVAKFLTGAIGYLDITKTTLDAYERFYTQTPKTLDDIFEIDAMVRDYYA